MTNSLDDDLEPSSKEIISLHIDSLFLSRFLITCWTFVKLLYNSFVFKSLTNQLKLLKVEVYSPFRYIDKQKFTMNRRRFKYTRIDFFESKFYTTICVRVQIMTECSCFTLVKGLNFACGINISRGNILTEQIAQKRVEYFKALKLLGLVVMTMITKGLIAAD